MTTTEDLLVTRAEAVGMLARIKELDSYIRDMKEEADALRAHIRAVLEDDREPLVDGERGLVATLKSKRKPDEVDLISMAEQHPEYLASLAQAGALSVRLTQLKGLRGKSAWADGALHFLMPGGETHELRIESAR